MQSGLLFSGRTPCGWRRGSGDGPSRPAPRERDLSLRAAGGRCPRVTPDSTPTRRRQDSLGPRRGWRGEQTRGLRFSHASRSVSPLVLPLLCYAGRATGHGATARPRRVTRKRCFRPHGGIRLSQVRLCSQRPPLVSQLSPPPATLPPFLEDDTHRFCRHLVTPSTSHAASKLNGQDVQPPREDTK